MNQNESGVDPPHSWIGQGVTHSVDSPNRRSREGGQIPSPPGRRRRMRVRKWVEMEGNGSELKVCRSWPLVMNPPQPSPPRRRSDPLALWERVRVRVRKCNEMQPNATELKICRSWPLVMNPPQPSPPRRRSDPLALWERVRVRVREWNEMEQNGTELKVRHSWPLLTRPNEASVASCWHSGTSERCASGVPNEAGVASFSALPLGVNEAKWSQMSHKFEISPRGAQIPSPSGRGLG